MTAPDEQDLAYFGREYDRLTRDMMSYYDSIVQTERLAIAGAAAVIAFLYTDLPVFAAGQSQVLSALPAAIIVLAGLRCLSIYLVITEIAAYLRRLEAVMTRLPEFGFQRSFGRTSGIPVRRMIEVTTTSLWVLATAVTVYFWSVYDPPAAAAG